MTATYLSSVHSTPRISDFYKAPMVQAQRLHLECEDFDITENTILNSHLFPEHFEQVKKSVSTHLTQYKLVLRVSFFITSISSDGCWKSCIQSCSYSGRAARVSGGSAVPTDLNKPQSHHGSSVFCRCIV
ncbi:hypothetical protein BDR03DRAFT_972268 [Suillus americanus]|nr:hypothetical protein BDR03DRAFT_972268 [Suillus americanus]